MAQLLRPWSVQGPAGLRFVDGRGIWLTAADGRRYIDMCSQLMAVNLGHGDRRVTDAVGRQMAQVSYVNPAYETESRAEVTERLAEILPPGIDRILLTTGGAEAVENAIKLARIVTGRPKIITRYRSYHGATAAAITASGDPRRHPTAAFETPGIVRIEDPYCYRCPWHHHPETCELECLAHVERIITLEGPETIAGIMLEGESGTSGCIKYPLGYWKRIESIARKYGILLIADEVMSGFGRCGDWFAVTRHGVTPDIIVMAKGLTSGYVPMGGIAVRGSLIFPRFEQDVLPLGLTYAKPDCCRS
ncbi:aminotransferase class III-fold pyridoxal phosphate-dependent enzyme [bacterium]|nr:aminotransferase class III-fold pyridoxal phosphate-dependent enzyme [bacterium]